MKQGFVGVGSEKASISPTPDMDAGQMRHRLQQGGFAGTVFTDKEGDRCGERDGARLLKHPP